MKILFVDDDKDILNSLKRQMRKEDFQVVTANSGKDALSILEKESFPVIVSDERMPEMSGVELLKQVKKIYPDSIRMILSGYADSKTIIDAINQGEIYRFIAKPWDIDDLKNSLYLALDKWTHREKNKSYLEKIIEENKKLKKRLSYRESKLNLNPELLNELIVPVILIGKDDKIESFNKLSESIFNNKLTPGIDIHCVIPPDIYQEININFLSDTNYRNWKIEIENTNFNIIARGFRATDSYKGIIIFEEESS